MSKLIDGIGRRIDHLRLSVTSACDLRCVYCRPASEVEHAGTRRLLSDDQRVELVQFLHDSSCLKQVRLTGGEPLLHRGMVSLVARIRAAAPNLSIALTTNAIRLRPLAVSLRSAGLDRLNISLDSLDRRLYRALTGGDLGSVLAGIDGAMAAGFPPPKVNTVALRGLNDHEIPRLASWGARQGIEVRFLEAMPIGPAARLNQERFVSADEILSRLRHEFELMPIIRGWGSTAMRYRIRNSTSEGVIGLIAPITQPFCAQCRRIRVTADGQLYPCLMDNRCFDLQTAWQGAGFDRRIAGHIIQQAIDEKPPSGGRVQQTVMVRLGG